MEQYMEKPEILMLTQQSLQSENFKEMLSKNTETMNSFRNATFCLLIFQLRFLPKL